MTNNSSLGFIYISTAGWAAQNGALTEDQASSSNIIFIEPTNQIYVGGTYIGITPSQAEQLSDVYAQVVTGGTGTLKTKVANLESKVGDQSAIATTLVAIANDLKSKLDGGSYGSEGPQGTALNTGDSNANANVVAAINYLSGLIQSTGSTASSAIQSVNGQTGTSITLTGDNIQVGTAGPQGPQGDISISSALSGIQSSLSVINGDASTNGSIAKAQADAISTAATDATNKANAAQTAAETAAAADATNKANAAKDAVIGTSQAQTNWGNDEVKTLTTLRDLIKAQADTISTMSSLDQETADKLTQIIAEIKDGDGTGTDFAQTIIDKYLGLQGNSGGTYTVNNGTQTTLQGIINAIETRIGNINDALSGSISTLDGAAVKSVNNQTPTNGAVTVGAGDINMTSYTTTSISGNVSTSDTINGAVAKVEVKADTALTNASNAQTTANSAENKADNALTQLSWIVV